LSCARETAETVGSSELGELDIADEDKSRAGRGRRALT
jgi:hypothetical protein